MRFIAIVGAVALFAVASADQTGENEAANPNSGSIRVLTSDTVTVTVTDANCSGGKCAAQTSPLSTPNALTVLSNALNTPTPSNALVILSEAEGSFGVPVIPVTFPPELYSSYGLSGISEQSSQEETAPATPGTTETPATYSTTTTDVATTTTTPVVIPTTPTDTTATPATPSTLSTVPSGESTANPVSSSAATTSGVTTTPTTGAIPTESGASTYGSSVVSPVGSGSSTTIPADTTGDAGSTTATGSSTGGAGTSGGAGASSTQSDVTANPATGTESGSGPAETTPAPVNFGVVNKPAAYGGIVAAAGALLFI